MPTLLLWKGHRFLLYSKEIGEPPHIHVLKDGKQLKVWLRGLGVARNAGFGGHEVNGYPQSHRGTSDTFRGGME